MRQRLHVCRQQTEIVLIDQRMVAQIEGWLSACQNCAENASLVLDYLLDALTGSDPARTEYLMYRCATCPACFGEITEKTLVRV